MAAPPLPPPTRTREQVRAELGLADEPLVLAVGRVAPQKAYDVLVDAAAHLGRRRPPPVVAVAGDGPARRELAAYATSVGAPVRFLGHRGDVPDLLAAADVAVLTSEWEARALVAQEALRAGVALVATAVGGVPELVGDAAVLVPWGPRPRVAAAVAGGVTRVLDDPALAARLRARGSEVAAAWPDEADTLARVEAVYAELLARG